MKNTITKRFLSLAMALAMIVGFVGLVPEMGIEIKASAKEITVFSQTDSRWANHPYGYSDTSCTTRAYISGGGCGILSYVNAVYYLNGSFIEPTYLADWSVSNGHRQNGVGTKLSLYKAFADAHGSEYGFAYNGNSSSYSILREHLQAGEVAIGSAPGHLMAVVDYDSSSGKYLILDSYKSSNRYTYEKGYTWQTETTCRNTSKLNFSTFYFLKSTLNPLDPDKLLKEKYGDPVDLGANFYAYIEHQGSGLYLTSSDNNIVGSSVAGAKNQIWHFVQLKNGAYKIQCKADNRFMDVYGSYDADDTNVYTWPEYTGATNQQFYIYFAYGAYYIRPAHTKTRMLDLSGASDHNLELWSMGTDWAPQEFNIKKISFNGYLPTNLGNSFYANVEHQSSGFYLTNQSSNIAGEKQNGTSNQVWKFTRLSNGAYKIQSSLDNGIMDVWGSYDTDDTNIYVCNKDTGAENQQFFIYKAYDAYYLRPVYSWTRMLDMESASPNNLELWSEGTDWSPQEFNIIKCDAPANIGDDFSALILNADAESKPWKPIMQTNDSSVQLGTEKNTNYDATLWQFKRNSDDGTYAILSYKNEKALDVNKSKDENGAGVICYKYAGSNNQRWTVYKRSDGTFYLRPKCSATRVLDVKGGSTEDNTPVQLYTSNDSTAQCFCIYQLDKTRDKLNYNISAAKSSVPAGTKVDVTVAGTVPYVYNYNFHIVDPNGKETTKNNGCNPVYSFSGTTLGKYTIYAEVKNPLATEIGSVDRKSVIINVTCDHKYDNTIIPPTCTEKGYTIHKCSVCEEEYKDSYTDALGHDYKAEVTKAVTCTEDGEKTYTCTRCKDSYTEPIKAEGHKYETTTVAPTDIEAGYDEHVCSVCGDTYRDNIIPAKGHNYTSEVTKEPTCTEDGIRTYTCDCGDTYIEPIKALGHSYVDVVIDPTCTAKGYTVHKCSVCKYEYKDSYTAALGHNYKVEMTKPATCTEDGTMTYTCLCGDSYTEPILATGHSWKAPTYEWSEDGKTCTATRVCANNPSHKETETVNSTSVIKISATCTEMGTTTYTVEYENTAFSTQTKDIQDIAATGHSYVPEVSKSATCTENGLMTYTCSCGETYTEPIIASGHKYVDTVVDPTCTESGYTLHRCSACGDSYKDTYTFPIGHSYTSKVTKAATCTTDGVRTYLCTECGDTYTETITATGHQYEVRGIAPTTEAQGYTEHTCSVCGDSYRDNYTDKLPYTDIATCAATLSSSSYTYDGTAKKPTVTVKNGSTTLKSGTDYTVAYKNNTNAGTATVTITGKGSYTGTASKTFTIKKASIANFAATLSVSTYTYNGSAKKPTVTVKNGSKTLTTSDYTVAYKNNTAVGTATVTVTGKGNYSGTLSKTFTINLANVTGFKNVAVSANAIKFTWNRVSGADGYVVYLYNKAAKKWERYAKTTGGNNVQLVNKLNPGEAYALTARAYKTVNGKEVLSPSFTNFKTSTNPAKVSFSVTSKAKGTATYSWSKVTGATSYALYYKASSSASWTKVASVSNSTTSYTKTGLKSGTGYFTVRAFRTYEGTTYGSAFDTKTAKVK